MAKVNKLTLSDLQARADEAWTKCEGLLAGIERDDPVLATKNRALTFLDYAVDVHRLRTEAVTSAPIEFITNGLILHRAWQHATQHCRNLDSWPQAPDIYGGRPAHSALHAALEFGGGVHAKLMHSGYPFAGGGALPVANDLVYQWCVEASCRLCGFDPVHVDDIRKRIEVECLKAQSGLADPPKVLPQDGTVGGAQAVDGKLTKTALVAAIAQHLQPNPSAKAKEIGDPLGLTQGRIRQVWQPIKEAARRGDRSKLHGYMLRREDGSTCSEAVDESTHCDTCRSLIDPTWTCPVPGCGGQPWHDDLKAQLCPDCHNSVAGHPESRYVKR